MSNLLFCVIFASAFFYVGFLCSWQKMKMQKWHQKQILPLPKNLKHVKDTLLWRNLKNLHFKEEEKKQQIEDERNLKEQMAQVASRSPDQYVHQEDGIFTSQQKKVNKYYFWNLNSLLSCELNQIVLILMSFVDFVFLTFACNFQQQADDSGEDENSNQNKIEKNNKNRF